MGLLKGTLTFTRYRLPGKLPRNFREFVDGQIKAYAFREGSSGTEEISSGWTGLENILDTKFEKADYLYGDYLLLSLRLDRKAVPPALLKLKLLEAERKLSGAGRKRITKEQRDEIKERIRIELLSRAHPVPSFYDVCWSLSGNWLLFGSISAKPAEEFETLFKKTFDTGISPFVPWDEKHMETKLAEQVASLKAGVFLDPGREETSDAPALGREFLTWLWFKSEERGGAVMIPDVGDVEVVVSRRLALESGDGEYSETVVCQGLHADLKEGKAALREGKKVKEARLQLSLKTDQWEFTLKGDPFQFQSLKLPSGLALSEEGEEKEGRLLERISLVENAVQTMDQLFAFFLRRRVSGEWAAEEIPRIKKWMQR